MLCDRKGLAKYVERDWMIDGMFFSEDSSNVENILANGHLDDEFMSYAFFQRVFKVFSGKPSKQSIFLSNFMLIFQHDQNGNLKKWFLSYIFDHAYEKAKSFYGLILFSLHYYTVKGLFSFEEIFQFPSLKKKSIIRMYFFICFSEEIFQFDVKAYEEELKFFSDIASDLYNIMYIYDYTKLLQNDRELLKEISSFILPRECTSYSIFYDDIELFQQISSSPEFVFSQTFCFSSPEFVLIYSDDLYQVDLLSFAALYGSVKCFKYIMVNHDTFHYMIMNHCSIGGNLEILHLVLESKTTFESCLTSSIIYSNYDVFVWLIENKYDKIALLYDPEYVRAFYKAIRVHDCRIIDYLLSIGNRADIIRTRERYEFSITPLHESIKYLGWEIFEEFLSDETLNINIASEKKDSIVFAAIDCPNPKILQLLWKDPRLNLNIKNKRGFSILHALVEKGLYDYITDLVYNKGFDINFNQVSKNTPPIFCVKTTEALDFLLGIKNINPFALDYRGENILFKFIREENLELFKRALRIPGIDIYLENKDGKNVFFLALEKTSTNFVMDVISLGVFDVKMIDQNGRNALFYSDGNPELFEYLRNTFSLDIYQVDKYGYTIPIFSHINQDKWNQIRVNEWPKDLLTKFDNKGNCILHYAFDSSSYFQKYHRDSEININIRGENGLSPIHLALMKKRPEIVDYILHCPDCDVNILDSVGNTILHYAVKYYVTMVIAIKMSGVNVNQKNNDGLTPIMMSTDNICVELLTYDLLDINAVNNEGQTILHMMASKFGNRSNNLLTLRKDLNLDMRDKFGKTAAHYFSEHENMAGLKTLMRMGANFGIRDNEGKLPCDYSTKVEKMLNSKQKH